MKRHVRFDLPPECRTFAPFHRLPPELRQRIWELTLDTPGIQFLKLQSSTNSWQWLSPGTSTIDPNSEDIYRQRRSKCFDEINSEVQREGKPRRVRDIHLIPQSPNARVDASYYTETHRRLAALSSTCRESRALATSLKLRRGVLRLGNGEIASLQDSDDVICLEYLPREFYNSDYNFNLFVRCRGFDLISRLAVRFSYDWTAQSASRPCFNCGLFHASQTRRVSPIHLYQFMAKHLPNLKEFYFIDYFMLRKGPGPLSRATREKFALEGPAISLRVFHGTNRTFIEADSDNWHLQPKVLGTTAWLQDRFIRYAKASKYSQHKSPDKVHFGIMACEWDISSPEEHRTALAPMSLKGRNKRLSCEPHPLKLRRAFTETSPSSDPQSSTTSQDRVFGVSDDTGVGDFTFTFKCDVNGEVKK